MDLFFDVRDEICSARGHRLLGGVGADPPFSFASWPFGDACGPVAVQACAGDSDPVAEAFSHGRKVMMPGEGLVPFGLWVETEQPMLSECGKLPEKLGMAMPQGRNHLGGKPIFVTKPIHPRVELKEFML